LLTVAGDSDPRLSAPAAGRLPALTDRP